MQDVFSLTEGPVTIQWPASLSAESYEDFSGWLDLLKRKIGRSVVRSAWLKMPEDCQHSALHIQLKDSVGKIIGTQCADCGTVIR
jgi:hypothetical protein